MNIKTISPIFYTPRTLESSGLVSVPVRLLLKELTMSRDQRVGKNYTSTSSLHGRKCLYKVATNIKSEALKNAEPVKTLLKHLLYQMPSQLLHAPPPEPPKEKLHNLAITLSEPSRFPSEEAAESVMNPGRQVLPYRKVNDEEHHHHVFLMYLLTSWDFWSITTSDVPVLDRTGLSQSLSQSV